jgi:endonuclease YncB( thermonuclease family)
MLCCPDSLEWSLERRKWRQFRPDGRCSAAEGESTVKVVGISDGDTITVLIERTPVRVRLSGIDCPEIGQDFGTRAKAATSELAFGKAVTIHWRGHDRFGRIVADVILPDGRNVNHELVRRGLAWWYRNYAPHDPILPKLEAEARAAKLGLWSQPNPVPPWESRPTRKMNPLAEVAGEVIGNARSRVYHRPGCPNGEKVSLRNRVVFASEAAADRAGFRPGGDCH